MNDLPATALLALALGFLLSRIGFSSWDEVHRMFVLADPRLLLAFAFAVIVLMVAWRVVWRLSNPKPGWRPRHVHRGTLWGGALFGVGWALTGACPIVCVVQLGEGQLAAGYTLLGILAGNYLYSRVHERWLRWTIGSCLDD